MTTQTARESLDVARRHLARVQEASIEPTDWSDEPTDWSDLSVYGFACLEACVVAAALHLGRPRPGSHFAKADEARRLHVESGLPDIEDLLVDLSDLRKHEMYGDVDFDAEDLDPEDVAAGIEQFFEAVEGLLEP